VIDLALVGTMPEAQNGRAFCHDVQKGNCEANGQGNQGVKREKATGGSSPPSWFQPTQCYIGLGQTNSETAGETRDGISGAFSIVKVYFPLAAIEAAFDTVPGDSSTDMLGP
jgi:hypothetical protein